MKKYFSTWLKKTPGSAALLLLFNNSSGQTSTADSSRYTLQLIRIEQQLMDDIPAGNTVNWDKYLNNNFFIITEDGSMLQKTAFLKTFHPMPKGYSGYINVINPKTVFNGSTAVISYVSDEYENVFASKIHTQYNSMNTYIRADTSWTMISSQVFEIPLLPPAIRLPVAVLKKYTGVYQLTDSITCSISLESDTLYYQRKGRARMALSAEAADVFFNTADARGRKLFMVDDKGLMWMRERRNGQDVNWKRIKDGG